MPHFSRFLREVEPVPRLDSLGLLWSLITDDLPRLPYDVPRNLKRYYGDGDLHFITCSCYQRQAGGPHLAPKYSPEGLGGCPSIRAKALSRAHCSCPVRGTGLVCRETSDLRTKDSGISP